MKKISFQSLSDKINFNENKPSPAVKVIPNWFRKMPKFPTGKRTSTGTGQINMTLKACSPFLDSLSIGYVIRLEYDLYVKKVNNVPHFEWAEGGVVVSSHNPNQVMPEQIPSGFSKVPYKFENKYVTKTPSGYSTLFTHPLNRTDLPFITLSGVVETDEYNLAVNLPFIIRDDFEGFIEAGTPIAQCIPIKREAWSHEVIKADLEKANNALLQLRHKMVSSYKSQWWKRKDYR